MEENFVKEEESKGKFGTFGGVFTPTVLTILGAIMYLREGWVVGNAGLVGGIAIILLANLITISTGLSISTIATNIRVRAGGAFSIISQSLGLEVGGSVSVPLYLALAISVGFYIFAFMEGYLRIFPNHPNWLIVFASFAIAFIIAYVSANLVVRVQFIIMAIIFLSLFAIFLGSFPILGREGMIHTPELWGSFPAGGFWQVFAVFFPAVTGVLAGVNMSGDLKDPRESIPKGMLSAVVLTLIIYLILAYWLSRVAMPQELVDNETIMVDKSVFGPIVLAGLLAATFSSALTSLVGASRVLQALAKHRVLPGSEKLAELTEQGEPRNAMFVTGGIAVLALIFGLAAGGVNAIAPLITMFFLIMYATLNGVVLLEQKLGLISFRPLLSIPWFVPLIGLIGCLFSMFLINPLFSLIAIVFTIALYGYLGRRQLMAPWGDVRSGLFVTIAEWSAKRVIGMPESERAWKPKLLMPVRSSGELLGSFRFLKALVFPRGSIHVVGLTSPGSEERVSRLDEYVDGFSRDGIFSRLSMVNHTNPENGLHVSLDVLRSVFFRPNIIFLPVTEESDEDELQKTIERGNENEMGVILFSKHPVAAMGREQMINVWVRDQSPEWELGLRLSNLDLAILLAYQLHQNWRGKINLITVISKEENLESAQRYIRGLIQLGRLPGNTEMAIEIGKFSEKVTKAPRADINIFGLQPRVNLEFVQKMVEATKSSCVFVQDSGKESALA